MDTSELDFTKKAIELFHFQYQTNETYRNYCNFLHVNPTAIQKIEEIPFLPISTFKTQEVKSTEFNAQEVFTSSGTSSTTSSKHHVKKLDLYTSSFTACFERTYGKIEEYRVLALLPSYLERNGSSLITMVDYFIKKSPFAENGFFLNNLQDLYVVLNQLKKENKKTLLIGVSFALLDFVETYNLEENSNLIVMETGGMKGRRREMIREELHESLKQGFSVPQIHSEYGMTELLSQAYSKGKGIFECPPWMKIQIRKQDDPFSYCKAGETGAINIIDFANLYSCSFIQTDDLGRMNSDGQFEVLGRFDAAEVRGCNLMV